MIFDPSYMNWTFLRTDAKYPHMWTLPHFQTMFCNPSLVVEQHPLVVLTQVCVSLALLVAAVQYAPGKGAFINTYLALQQQCQSVDRCRLTWVPSTPKTLWVRQRPLVHLHNLHEITR